MLKKKSLLKVFPYTTFCNIYDVYLVSVGRKKNPSNIHVFFTYVNIYVKQKLLTLFLCEKRRQGGKI